MKNNFNLPQVIVLDLDNTIYDYKKCNKKATDTIINFMLIRMNITKSEALKIWTKGRASIKKRLKNTAASHSRILYIREGFNLFGYKSELSLCLEIENLYWNTFIMQMQKREGFDKFITLARFHGIKIALLTDLTDQIQLRKILNLELENSFDLVVTSELAGGDKISYLPMQYFFKHLKKNEKLKHFWFIGDNKTDFPKKNKSISLSHDNLLISQKYILSSKSNSFKDFVKIEKILDNLIKIKSNSEILKG